MSEVKPRPSAPRGRGSSRGRGGYSSRGGRGGSRQANGHKEELPTEVSYEDEGELGDLKKMYASKLGTIKEMFPDWTDEDLVFALQETNGDLERTVDRISEGNIAQWGEVKKKTKERSQSKAKEPLSSTEIPTSSRGGRGRGGLEGVRGGRGRGSDRGRGAGAPRGRGASVANGVGSTSAGKTDTVPAKSTSDWETPVSDGTSGGWDQAAADATPMESSWENISADVAQPPPVEEVKPPSKPDGTRSWASMFSKPAPVPKAPRAIPSHDAPIEPPITATSIPEDTSMPGLPPPVAVDETLEIPKTPPVSDLAVSEPVADITPSKDELTETNVERVLDASGPPPSATAASTVASTIDPQSGAGGATPLHQSQQTLSSRPPLGGFATSAYKATGMPGRSASYQRKIQEQQEAVVMPGKHAVDRAAVQFGSMGLNGSTEDVDVDSDREDAETRAQPPQHSPIAPRAALPPVPQQQGFSSHPQMNDPLPTPRQAPGLPPVNQPSAIQQPSQPVQNDTSLQSQTSQYPYNRYGQQQPQQEVSAPAQKAYEPFGQQIQQSQQFDNYSSTPQSQNQPQQQAQPQQGGYSSASNDVPSYYTSDGQRNAYQNSIYGNYGQQSQQSGQDSSASQQRGGSAFGTSAAEQGSHYATSQAQQPHQNRFGQTGEAQTSGHSTPNPSLSGQQQAGQPHQMLQQQAQGQTGGQQHGGYPYGHPYYGHPYYASFANQQQYGYGGSQGGYGGGPFGGAGGKQGMYGQPHQGYGTTPQTGYDQHSASPANTGAFAQQHTSSGRESANPGGLGNYGRTGSTQPSENTQQYSGAGASNHSSMPDVFGRSQSTYQGQNSGLGSHMGQQSGNDDPLRSYGDSSKMPGGPSPALGQPGGRPGSTANVPGQTGLPQSQGQGQGQGQQGYGGYMGHQMPGQQGSQYGGGPGGLGGGHHQSGGQNHQAGGYGAYGPGYGSGFYGNSNRGGWGANYGH